MIGVILWSDHNDRKAVIWCEDQGDLAFVSQGEPQPDGEDFFEVGDVVRFEVSLQRNLRLAHNPRRLNRNWGASLPDSLQSIPDTPGALRTTHSAEVIPFRPGSRVAHQHRARSQQTG